MINNTEMELNKCQVELQSLSNFSHDNQYVGMLIINRMNQLASNIKEYEKMINLSSVKN